MICVTVWPLDWRIGLLNYGSPVPHLYSYICAWPSASVPHCQVSFFYVIFIFSIELFLHACLLVCMAHCECLSLAFLSFLSMRSSLHPLVCRCEVKVCIAEAYSVHTYLELLATCWHTCLLGSALQQLTTDVTTDVITMLMYYRYVWTNAEMCTTAAGIGIVGGLQSPVGDFHTQTSRNSEIYEWLQGIIVTLSPE